MLNIVPGSINVHVNVFKRTTKLQTVDDASVQKGEGPRWFHGTLLLFYSLKTKTPGKRSKPLDVTPWGSPWGGAMPSLEDTFAQVVCCCPGLMGTSGDAHGH